MKSKAFYKTFSMPPCHQLTKRKILFKCDMFYIPTRPHETYVYSNCRCHALIDMRNHETGINHGLGAGSCARVCSRARDNKHVYRLRPPEGYITTLLMVFITI